MMCRAAMTAIASAEPEVTPAICGVAINVVSARSGLLAGGGSVEKLSSAAPATVPAASASASAVSLMMPPRGA